jgi:hypothetical protein
MATISLLDSQHLQKYERALSQLGVSNAAKKQRPIVQRTGQAFSRKEAVDAAAKALASIWINASRYGGKNR